MKEVVGILENFLSNSKLTVEGNPPVKSFTNVVELTAMLLGSARRVTDYLAYELSL